MASYPHLNIYSIILLIEYSLFRLKEYIILQVSTIKALKLSYYSIDILTLRKTYYTLFKENKTNISLKGQVSLNYYYLSEPYFKCLTLFELIQVNINRIINYLFIHLVIFEMLFDCWQKQLVQSSIIFTIIFIKKLMIYQLMENYSKHHIYCLIKICQLPVIAQFCYLDYY